MSLLLDTQVLLWWLKGDERLPSAVERTLAEAPDPMWISAVFALEVVKPRLGKLKVPDNWWDVATSDFRPLDFRPDHALAVGELPTLHRDPFDRALVAQATQDGLRLVTFDPKVRRYDVPLYPP